ncbi:hypothetical protein BaRGS_00037216 [Batillaria attramentaria]|uniref:Uncharacterized protein n=1 Tax=Batillaria attramentaria TaxID=370345 RepID=A0ABD0J9D8_9CAEN
MTHPNMKMMNFLKNLKNVEERALLMGRLKSLMGETPLESDPHSGTAMADLSDGWGLDDINKSLSWKTKWEKRSQKSLQIS